jgi:hypothetical protein
MSQIRKDLASGRSFAKELREHLQRLQLKGKRRSLPRNYPPIQVEARFVFTNQTEVRFVIAIPYRQVTIRIHRRIGDIKSMGSGSQKQNDRPIINAPVAGAGGGAGVGRGGSARLSNVCPEFFNLPLEADPFLRRNQALSINDAGEILQGSRVVAVLSPKYISRLEICRNEGYRYRGKVAEDKRHVMYGRFERYTA